MQCWWTTSVLRPTTTTTASKRTALLEDVYVYCNKGRKETNRKWGMFETNKQFETEISIREAVDTLNNNEPNMKIGKYTFCDRSNSVA